MVILVKATGTERLSTARHIVSRPPEVRGEAMDEFVAEAQDKSRNALSKSLEAAYLAFAEQLASDQMQFEQQKLVCLVLVEGLVEEQLLSDFDLARNLTPRHA